MTFRFKRTPQQEAYRIARLREALAKPRREEWKRRQSEGVKRAFAEGRMPRRTRESIEKGAAKLRGRKRSPETVAKVRAGNLGKKRSVAMCQAQSELVKRGYAQGKYRLSAEGLVRRGQIISRAKKAKGWHPSEKQRLEHSVALRGRKQSAELVEKRRLPLVGRAQKALLTKKGPTNHRSLSGAIRSPDNVVYEFRNLTHFVREHPYLFLPEDVIWKPDGGHGSPRCRAQHGLLGLFAHHKDVRGSWKGWTIYSHVEQVYNAGDDLLGRELALG